MNDVTIEWFGCATFRVRIGGTTLFFDTYLDKAPGVPGAGLRVADVQEADFAFISHAHFDHVLGADVIAKATGATVVGNHEVVHLKDRARATRALFELLPTLSDETRAYFDATRGRSSHRDGGQLAYLLETPDGSLLVSASPGYWHGIFGDVRPDVAILAAAGRPNLDGEPYQGSMADFLVEQAELLGGPIVALCHHDPLLPPIAPAYDVSAAEEALRAALGESRYRTFEYGQPTALFPA